MTEPRVCLTAALTLIGIVLLVGVASVRVAASGAGQDPPPDLSRLEAMTARFAPADLGTDLKALPTGERQALAKLIEAARVIDAIYLQRLRDVPVDIAPRFVTAEELTAFHHGE